MRAVRGGPYFRHEAETKPQQFGAATPTPTRSQFAMPMVEQGTVMAKSQGMQDSTDDPTMFMCSSLQEWHGPEADNYQGLRVARRIDPLQWQFVADQLTPTVDFRENDGLHKEYINLDTLSGQALQDKIQQAAQAVSHGHGLPPALENLVCQDAQELAVITSKLVPKAKQLILKLELFGPSACVRWHRDRYVCRSIVSYNCSATEYTANSNVDFYEMDNCGNNDHIIRDKCHIRSIDVGDILMIKGMYYPGKARGLVHKSPPIRYYNGQDFAPLEIRNKNVQSRIVLKVDVQDLQGGEVENSCTGD